LKNVFLGGVQFRYDLKMVRRIDLSRQTCEISEGWKKEVS